MRPLRPLPPSARAAVRAEATNGVRHERFTQGAATVSALDNHRAVHDLPDLPDLLARLRTLPIAVADRPWLVHLGRYCRCDWMLGIGEAEVHLTSRDGRLESVQVAHRHLHGWSFAIRGPLASWQAFWQPIPPRGFHDVFAMTTGGHVRLEGDMSTFRHDLRYFKEVLALPRPSVGEAPGVTG